ncbi:MAG: hypothetical protein K0Q95_1517 [Bacteroidota bacterium]|jgi:uncharacterized membrane protein (TIGR01666 family)|nr:hypothetical protein [Bacteroidota bacterium]
MRQIYSSTIPYFFFSQALSDGIRITFSLLAPVLFFRHIGQFETGLAISLGAICVNITDIPGPLIHKRNGLLISCALIFIASLISGVFHFNVYLTGLIITVSTFIFTMFSVYGVRAATVGSSALLIMILSLRNEHLSFSEHLYHCLLILSGALWYTAISLLSATMGPYRMAQRALGECIRETAKYLALKAHFYDTRTRLELNYRELLAQQVIVIEKQDTARELLYKTRQIVKDTNGTGRSLMLTFVEAMDLFELITASYYNYQSIRKEYDKTPILKNISKLLKHMSFELNDIGFAIQSNRAYKKDFRIKREIEELRNLINETEGGKYRNHHILAKLIENIETVYQHIKGLEIYFEENATEKKDIKIEHKPFINHQDYSFEILQDNLTLESSVFRHTLRVTIACMIGFVVAQLLNYGHHSYWILITIVFIMKPAFSLTKQRNMQRLLGTAVGGLLGLVILYFIKDPSIVFSFLLAFMLGTYTFMRINYIAMVICTTPYVLILFKITGTGYISVIEERVIDTAVGCAIALLSGYLLFPKWEAEELDDHLRNVLKANLNYIQYFAGYICGQPIDRINYKLARKEVFVSSANLSAAFQRMLSEPKKKRTNSTKVYEFVVLNHILSSNIAGLTADKIHNMPQNCSNGEVAMLEKIQATLKKCLKEKEENEIKSNSSITIKDTESQSLKGHLEFILNLCADIYKAKQLILKES